MKNMRFLVGTCNPCLFFNPTRDLRVLCRGDDFVRTGRRGHPAWFKSSFKMKFDCKDKILGPRP